MQEFLTNNTVSCNLMSLTGYRTLVILSALLESPKSNDEINECLLNNQYIGEKFSGDTLRIYINNLRAIGCEITRANKTNNQKYTLVSHPFCFDVPKSQLKALAKLYRSFYDKIDINDTIDFEKFFRKLGTYIGNESTKEHMRASSVLKNIDFALLDELLFHCKKKNEIIISYSSPRSGIGDIHLVADKLSFKSEKLYLWGDNITHKEYSYFVVERIKRVSCVKLLKSHEEIPAFKVVYEIYNDMDYRLDESETLIERCSDKLIIQAVVKNEFDIAQKLLHRACDCKIVSPSDFKNKVIRKLKAMEKLYE